MNPLSLILSILDTLGQIAMNPALGLGGDGARVAKIVSFVAMLGREGDEGYQKLADFDAQIKAIEAGQVNDLSQFWSALEDRHAAAHARLQALKDG